MSRNNEEPVPVVSPFPCVWDIVLNEMDLFVSKDKYPNVYDFLKNDIKERDEMGLGKYGVRLQPYNGRRADIDLYQELLDALVYTRQQLFELTDKDDYADVRSEFIYLYNMLWKSLVSVYSCVTVINQRKGN